MILHTFWYLMEHLSCWGILSICAVLLCGPVSTAAILMFGKQSESQIAGEEQHCIEPEWYEQCA